MLKRWSSHLPVLLVAALVVVAAIRRDHGRPESEGRASRSARERARHANRGDAPLRTADRRLRAGWRETPRLAATTAEMPEILRLPESEILKRYRRRYQVHGGDPVVPGRPEIPDVPVGKPKDPPGGDPVPDPQPEPEKHHCPQEVAQTGPTAPVGAIPHSTAVGHDGSFQVTIPLEVPPGPNGSQPRLALVYNSRSGNGYLGVGWRLSGLSQIRMVRRNLAEDGFLWPAYGDIGADDRIRQPHPYVYELDGRRLVAVGNDEYRTKPDTFSRIRSYGPVENRTWKVWTKDGRILEFGTGWGYPPGLNRRYTWPITSETDPTGNETRYIYDSLEDSRNELSYWIRRIEYGRNDRAGRPATRRILFHYVENRSDSITHYRDGVRGTTDRVLERITMYYGADDPGSLIRTYRLVTGPNPTTGALLLRELHELAADGVAKRPLRFDYTGQAPAKDFTDGPSRFAATSVWANLDRLKLSRRTARYAIPLDMNGDGRDDLLSLHHVQWQVQFGGEEGLGQPRQVSPGGGGFFDDIPVWAVAHRPTEFLDLSESGLLLGSEGVTPVGSRREAMTALDYFKRHSFVQPQVLDYDGDGRMEVMFFRPQGDNRWYTTHPHSKRFLRKREGPLVVTPEIVTWTGQGFRTAEINITIDIYRNRLQPTLRDINGDGRKDLVYLRKGPNEGPSVLCYRLLENDGFGREYRTRLAPYSMLGNKNEDPIGAQYFMDIDGDGAVDVLYWDSNALGWEWIRFLDAADENGDLSRPDRIATRATNIFHRREPFLRRLYVDTGFGNPDYWAVGLVFPLSGFSNSHPVDPGFETIDDNSFLGSIISFFGGDPDLRVRRTGIWEDQGSFYTESPVYFDRLHLLDSNGDGLTDVAWWQPHPDPRRADTFVLYVQLNTGRGFTDRYDAYEIGGLKRPPSIVSTLDVDGDGRHDLLLATVSTEGPDRWGVSLSKLGFIDAATTEGGSLLLRSTGTAFERRHVNIPPYRWTELKSVASRVTKWHYDDNNEIWIVDRIEQIDEPMWNNYPHWGWIDEVVALDVNGDGHDDVAYLSDANMLREFSSVLNRNRSVLLERVTDSFEAVTNILYKRLNDAEVYTPRAATEYPFRDLLSRRSVVWKIQMQHRAGDPDRPSIANDYNEYVYAYGEGLVHLRGRGELGCGWRTVQNTGTGALTKYTYDLSRLPESADFPYAGVPDLIEEERPSSRDGNPRNADRTEKKVIDPHYEVVPLHDGKTYARFLASQTIDHHWNLQEQPYLQTTIRFVPPPEDQFYGAPIQVDTQTVVTSFGSQHGPAGYRTFHSVRTEPRHIINGDHWILNLPELVTETAQIGNQPATTRTARYGYLENGLLQSRMDEPVADPVREAEIRLTVVFDRDAFGNLTRTTSTPGDPAWGVRIEETDYDEDGVFPVETRRFSTYLDAQGEGHEVVHRTRFCWHPGLGVPVRKEEPGGVVTTYVYDGFGRILEEHHPDGTSDHTRYSAGEGYPFIVTGEIYPGRGDRAVSVEYHDLRGRVVNRKTRTLRGEWSIQEFEYDARGRRSLTSIPDFIDRDRPLGTAYEYDTLDRLVKKVHPDRIATEFRYDHLTTMIVDRLGREKVEVNGPGGRLLASVDVEGSVTRYEYDGRGNLTKIVLPGGSETRMEYDAYGRRTRVVHPDLGEILYRNDSYGQVIRKVHGEEVTDFEYDTVGRLVRRWNPRDGEARWRFDQSFPGRLAAKGFGRTSTVYQYDLLGRVERKTVNIENGSFNVGYSYDESFGRLRDLTYPGGLRVRHRYNDWGRLRRLEKPNGSRYWEATETDPFDRITRERCGNGVWSNRVYEPSWRGWLTELQVGEERSPTSLVHIGYDYDKMGNLKSRDHHDAGIHEDFGYDRLDRLEDWKFGGDAGAASAHYAYDSLGNLREKTGIGEMLYEDAARPHRLTGIRGDRFLYDADGNLTHGMGLDLTWTTFDKPRTIRGMDGDVSFVYDADGGRVLKRGPRGATYYGEGIYELRIQGKSRVETKYLHGPNGVVATLQSPGGVQYLHTDALGSVVAVTTSDRKSKRLFYDPFGRRIRNDGSAIDHYRELPVDLSRGFSGHEHDDEVGVINMGGRIMSPLFGRFVSADPVLDLRQGAQGHNPYSYVYNNPFRWTDPDGLTPEGVDAITGADPGLPPPTERTPDNGPADTGAAPESTNNEGGDRTNKPLPDNGGNSLTRTEIGPDGRMTHHFDATPTLPPPPHVWTPEDEYEFQLMAYRTMLEVVRNSILSTSGTGTGGGGAITRGAGGKTFSHWGSGIKRQGLLAEKTLGGNLPAGFKTVDRIVGRTVASIKSMDLARKSYQTAQGILNRGRAYLRALQRFEGARKGGVVIRRIDFSLKRLDLAVPYRASPVQREALQQLVREGQAIGIEVRIIPLR